MIYNVLKSYMLIGVLRSILMVYLTRYPKINMAWVSKWQTGLALIVFPSALALFHQSCFSRGRAFHFFCSI